MAGRALTDQILKVLPFVTEPPDASGEIPPAVLVFAQKAVAADAGFSLGQHNLDDVTTICREVGGLPLAIELAASTVRCHPCCGDGEPAARPQGIGLLRDDTVERTDRHASMEQALDWTYGLLTDDERRLLDQLSVFEGSFDLEAALRVTTPEAADSAEMLDRLSGLVDVQLVDLDPRDPDNPRFTLPRLVRSYATRRLARSGDDVGVRSRHARYFQARCHRPVTPELLPDILAALDRAIVAGHVDEALHAAVAATAQPAGPGAARVLQERVDGLVGRLEGESADPVLLARALIRSATGVERVVEGQSYAEWTAGSGAGRRRRRPPLGRPARPPRSARAHRPLPADDQVPVARRPWRCRRSRRWPPARARPMCCANGPTRWRSTASSTSAVVARPRRGRSAPAWRSADASRASVRSVPRHAVRWGMR